MSGADWAIVVAIVVLFLFSIVLARRGDRVHAHEPHPRARRSRRRATSARDAARADARAPGADAQRVLLLVLVCQLTRATLLGIAARARRSAAPACVIGLVLQIVVFFVFGEVAPKTYAVQHPDAPRCASRALLVVLTDFPPLRLLSRGFIGLANVVLPGQGTEGRARSSPRRSSARWPTSPPTRSVDRDARSAS